MSPSELVAEVEALTKERDEAQQRCAVLTRDCLIAETMVHTNAEDMAAQNAEVEKLTEQINAALDVVEAPGVRRSHGVLDPDGVERDCACLYPPSHGRRLVVRPTEAQAEVEKLRAVAEAARRWADIDRVESPDEELVAVDAILDALDDLDAGAKQRHRETEGGT